ncbi:TatD family hydrolase [Microbulbifer salipaludis]|uniref:TatD family hydrolase n=1 Tax=Microbulbifer salipaludis TaxID=187980 RepID=A0ABS3E9S8_9GAMM|nr:TatD family hydrolase [Microbulbifer salipaludis]MBN8431938.1 TatD family hydrolase [Microbulbifer salipaludis]
MPLVDSHCHFDFDAFAPDRAEVWARSVANGVGALIIPGVSIPQWRHLFALVDSEPDWYGAVGVHPWWIKDLAIAPQQLQRALIERVDRERRRGGCVAIGECGLDANIDTSMEVQLAVFEAHLIAARERCLPLIVHAVRAHNEVIRMLKKLTPPQGGVIHAFSGSREIAEAYIELGFSLGVGGTITYTRAAKTRNTLAGVALESLLLESDAPDMPHAGRQGERNSPEYLPTVAETLAELRGISVDDVICQTEKNTRALFAI